MDTKAHSKSSVGLIDGRRTDKKIQTRSLSSVQTKQAKFLLALTIWTWIVSGLLSILFYCAVRNGLAGTDWLAINLLAMVLLGWIMTAYYYRAGSKSIQAPVHGTVWSILLFLITTVNIFSLAHFVLGRWEAFQSLPLLGTFPLILIIGGTHFSHKKKSHGELFILLVWALVLFLLAISTMVPFLELIRVSHIAQ